MATVDRVRPACAARLWGRVTTWFVDHHDARTPAVLEREKYVFWHPRTGRFQRWMVLLPVLISQLAIGSLYSWSIFNSTMDKVWGTPGLNANAFMIGVAFFGLTTLTFGVWVERHGPFWSVACTAFFSPAGWALAALGAYNKSLSITYLFGVFHGIGAALTYISVTSTLQRWYCEFKGLATGIAVMGFGLGSLIVTTAGKNLLDVKGEYRWSVAKVQGVLAATFLVAFVLVLPFLREPPPGYVPPTAKYRDDPGWRGVLVRKFAVRSKRTPEADKHYTFLQALATQEFALCTVMFFGNVICGIVFLSSAADMTQNIFQFDASYAGFITSMLNLMNFTGRVGWGFVSDKIGRKSFYLLSTVVQSFAIGLMAVWIERKNFAGWMASFFHNWLLLRGLVRRDPRGGVRPLRPQDQLRHPRRDDRRVGGRGHHWHPLLLVDHSRVLPGECVGHKDPHRRGVHAQHVVAVRPARRGFRVPALPQRAHQGPPPAAGQARPARARLLARPAHQLRGGRALDGARGAGGGVRAVGGGQRRNRGGHQARPADDARPRLDAQGGVGDHAQVDVQQHARQPQRPVHRVTRLTTLGKGLQPQQAATPRNLACTAAKGPAIPKTEE